MKDEISVFSSPLWSPYWNLKGSIQYISNIVSYYIIVSLNRKYIATNLDKAVIKLILRIENQATKERITKHMRETLLPTLIHRRL